jgi:N-acetylmuramoyl-L-alanine amidase
VSIHANSASKKDASGQCPSATGAEVYYYETSSKGKNIAGNVQSELVSSLKLNNRGTKGTKKLYVLRNTKMPAILVELGFICNKNDFSVLSNKKKEIAQAIANGILKDFS